MRVCRALVRSAPLRQSLCDCVTHRRRCVRLFNCAQCLRPDMIIIIDRTCVRAFVYKYKYDEHAQRVHHQRRDSDPLRRPYWRQTDSLLWRTNGRHIYDI